MKIEGMTEEEVKRELEFIMKLGAPLKQYIFDSICSAFPEQSVRSRVLFNFLANFVCNTIHDISEPNHTKTNVMEIVENITAWVNNIHEGMIMNYDPKTNRVINKEEMH